MFHQTLVILFGLLSLAPHAKAQAGTTSVGPLLTCDLTTFACPGVNGCCTIGGCCGGGCCPNGYSCINEGTSDQTCCPSTDLTQCGTVTPSTDPDSGGSGSGNCLGIDNCPRDPERGLAWTCVLGQTCGLSYNECNPCVRTGGDSGDSGDSSDSGDTTTSPSTPTSTSTSSESSSSTSTPSTSSSGDASSGSSDEPNTGHHSGDDNMKMVWQVALGLSVGPAMMV